VNANAGTSAHMASDVTLIVHPDDLGVTAGETAPIYNGN
jgi:hypothetical protein